VVGRISFRSLSSHEHPFFRSVKPPALPIPLKTSSRAEPFFRRSERPRAYLTGPLPVPLLRFTPAADQCKIDGPKRSLAECHCDSLPGLRNSNHRFGRTLPALWRPAQRISHNVHFVLQLPVRGGPHHRHCSFSDLIPRAGIHSRQHDRRALPRGLAAGPRRHG